MSSPVLSNPCSPSHLSLPSHPILSHPTSPPILSTNYVQSISSSQLISYPALPFTSPHLPPPFLSSPPFHLITLSSLSCLPSVHLTFSPHLPFPSLPSSCLILSCLILSYLTLSYLISSPFPFPSLLFHLLSSPPFHLSSLSSSLLVSSPPIHLPNFPSPFPSFPSPLLLPHACVTYDPPRPASASFHPPALRPSPRHLALLLTAQHSICLSVSSYPSLSVSFHLPLPI